MASRLARLNGWQRLWFVGSICLGLWLIGWWPLPGEKAHDWDYRRSIERDFANPACQDYQVRPISELREPDFVDQACWHIYNSRRFDDTRTVPYTLAVYDRKHEAYWRNYYLTGCRDCRHGHTERAGVLRGLGNRVDSSRLSPRGLTPPGYYQFGARHRGPLARPLARLRSHGADHEQHSRVSLHADIGHAAARACDWARFQQNLRRRSRVSPHTRPQQRRPQQRMRRGK
jgi:hypothetical protein